MDLENEFVDVGGMEDVQIVATPTETPIEVHIVATPTETPMRPNKPTAAQNESDIRFEKWKVRWLAFQAEQRRLHDLKPAQKRFDLAVQYGQLDKVEAFLKSGEVDVNDTRQYYSPLQHAAMHGHVKTLQMILEHGGDVRCVDKGGCTALHSALLSVNHKRCETIVRALLLHGSEVSKSGRFGRTPIHCAVLHGSSALVKILLDHGADISKIDDRGHNTLHQLALRRPRSVVVRNKICRMLLDHGSDVRYKLRVLRMEDYSDVDGSDSENAAM
jgi:ankyrin repeat protein